MRVQVIQDSQGKDKGTSMPIINWQQQKALAPPMAERPSKSLILEELKEAIAELRLVEQGQSEARPVAELIDAL